jgi:hypothetical protein
MPLLQPRLHEPGIHWPDTLSQDLRFAVRI